MLALLLHYPLMLLLTPITWFSQCFFEIAFAKVIFQNPIVSSLDSYYLTFHVTQLIYFPLDLILRTSSV